MDEKEKPESWKDCYVVSRYIDNPLLIGHRKSDLRIYVLVLSYSPLRVYLHRGGFCRCGLSVLHSHVQCSKYLVNCSFDYKVLISLDLHAFRFSSKTYNLAHDNMKDIYTHLTNVAIQKKSKNYDKKTGMKWLMRNLKQYVLTQFEKDKVNKLFGDIQGIVIRFGASSWIQ